MTAVMTMSGVAVCLDVGVIVYERSIWELMFALQYAYVGTAIPRMLAPQFAQNFLQLFFENHTQIQCFDVKITINK